VLLVWCCLEDIYDALHSLPAHKEEDGRDLREADAKDAAQRSDANNMSSRSSDANITMFKCTQHNTEFTRLQIGKSVKRCANIANILRIR
jgi:hypothetical protein